MIKKLTCLIAAVLMAALLAFPACAANESGAVGTGDIMPEFTAELTDGTSATLSDLLKEKDLVVLNIFATWCGPCEMEFPEMEKTYQAHKDRMEILSLSGDPDDTMEMVADYKASHGLTFPMGQAGEVMDHISVEGFPTTFFLTSDGKVVFLKVGAFVQENEFEEKVTTLLSSDYDGTPLPEEKAKPVTLYILLLLPVILVVRVIGRWLLFRKAGIPGWQSLIPFISTMKEYDLCWDGHIGLVARLLGVAAVIMRMIGYSGILSSVLLFAEFLIGVPQSMKLAKVFGKGKGTGILLVIFNRIGRLCLGLSKAKYLGKEAV